MSNALGASGRDTGWHDVRVPSTPHTVPPRRVAADSAARVPASSAVPNRRSVLRATGGGALAIAVLGAAACTDDKPLEPDVLLAQEQSARTDAVWAQAAMAGAPEHSAALTTIAAQRTEHADTLRAEIDRAIGIYGDGTKPKSATPPVSPPPAPTPPPTVAALREQLTRSQRSAADLSVGQEGYRAGLLASISACCATHAGVLLA